MTPAPSATSLLSKFVLRFLEPDPYVYLAQLRSVAEGAVAAHDSWIAATSCGRCRADPERDIDIEVLRKVLDAMRRGVSSTSSISR